jgi:hypothetical protein
MLRGYLFSKKKLVGKGSVYGTLAEDFLKTIELVLPLNHSSQKNQGIGQKSLPKLLILCWFFHENQEFFVNF